MSATLLTYLFVALTFGVYIAIALWSRSDSTNEFYVAGGGVHPIANGAATAADWMSAASFLSMAGIIAFEGADGARYLMGWTGGYVLLAFLLAPIYAGLGSSLSPILWAIDTILKPLVWWQWFVSFLSRSPISLDKCEVWASSFRVLEVQIEIGVIIGMAIVFFYAVLGGMKGITYTQVAQYCVLIFAYLVPAIYVSILLTGVPLPMLGFGSTMADGSGVYLLDKLDGLTAELGMAAFTEGRKSTVDMFFIVAALMAGTAGLPHVIVRFFTVPDMRAARVSAGYALVFIALLYTTAPAVAAFSRINLIQSVDDAPYSTLPEWFSKWEDSGLLSWVDKNQDGRLQYRGGAAMDPVKPIFTEGRGALVNG